MNILMVIHQFLPQHVAGSEIYTYHLTRALLARGHRVHLFFTEIRPDRPQYELRRGELDGIPYFEAVHNRFFANFRHSYSDPDMDELFRQVLKDTQPDLVHFQHLYLHSIGYIEIARGRGLPMLYTLHEYMLMCLRGGLLLRPGPTLCEGPEPQACARCAASTYTGLPADSRSCSLPAPFRALAAKARRALSSARIALVRDGGERAFLVAVQRRRAEIQTELAKVDLFVAPSFFLRQRFVEQGVISPDRIIHSDYGIFIEPFTKSRRIHSKTLRVGYVGTIAEHKGVHLILEAFREIPEVGIECRIYGDPDVFPAYKQRLLAQGTPAAVRFMGSLENEKVAEAFADLDLLIVPSLWPENSPLTIHEAYLAGIPVLTSDCGGMAELVEHGRTGLHFRTGDAVDLRRQLVRLLREEGLLESLTGRFPPVKTIDVEAEQMEERYRLLLQGQRPVR